MRTKREDIKELRSPHTIYGLYKNQCFYETPKAYELWETKPLLVRIARISKRRIVWVALK